MFNSRNIAACSVVMTCRHRTAAQRTNIRISSFVSASSVACIKQLCSISFNAARSLFAKPFQANHEPSLGDLEPGEQGLLPSILPSASDRTFSSWAEIGGEGSSRREGSENRGGQAKEAGKPGSLRNWVKAEKGNRISTTLCSAIRRPRAIRIL